uniref:Uncharacterized protein n=1 Tax=Marseillevirus LCMAC202 TaxID=2506606 RepID=A0A481Z0Q5_9VIRU|nr:MAG: hypothetical protein LCMAC202_06180 [Marseillevirus LCMAC202]
MYIESLEENQELAKNFLIDVCKCLIKDRNLDLNYILYEFTDRRADTISLCDSKLVARVHTKIEAQWILLMFNILSCKGFSPFFIELESFEEDVIDPQTFISEMSFKYPEYSVNEFRKSYQDTLILSMEDMLYYLEKIYPNPIYHIMPDIRQLKEDYEKQI